jgi:hypothetical protein
MKKRTPQYKRRFLVKNGFYTEGSPSKLKRLANYFCKAFLVNILPLVS